MMVYCLFFMGMAGISCRMLGNLYKEPDIEFCIYQVVPGVWESYLCHAIDKGNINLKVNFIWSDWS